MTGGAETDMGGSAKPVSDASYVEIQRFLAEEAALLDRRAYSEWLGLFTPDTMYRVTMQAAQRVDAGDKEYAIIEEDIAGLELRARQIAEGHLTHAENPPSLTRRFLSGLRAWHGGAEGEFRVTVNLMVWRSRATLPGGGFYVGVRRDVLRRTGGGLRIAGRQVRLDHTTLQGGSMSILL